MNGVAQLRAGDLPPMVVRTANVLSVQVLDCVRFVIAVGVGER